MGVGVAIGQACMLLSAGHKGKRFMLPHATGATSPMGPSPASASSWRALVSIRHIPLHHPAGRPCCLLHGKGLTRRGGFACAAAMLQQPRVPPTGQRQAIEIQIKWREVLAQKQALLRILSRTTGHSEEKLDKAGLPAVLLPRACW